MPPMYSAEIFLQSWTVDSLAPSTEEGLTESPMLQRNCDQILICGWSREVLQVAQTSKSSPNQPAGLCNASCDPFAAEYVS